MNVGGRASRGNCDNLIGCAERHPRMPFSAYRDNFDAETLARFAPPGGPFAANAEI